MGLTVRRIASARIDLPSEGTSRMTRVLHRSIAHNYPVAASGSGIQIRDANGKDYIDASGGAAVSCLGHGHPDVLAAMHRQLDQSGLRAHELLHDAGCRGTGAKT